MSRPMSSRSGTLAILEELDGQIADELRKREAQARITRLEAQIRTLDRLCTSISKGPGLGRRLGSVDHAAGDGALQASAVKQKEFIRQVIWKVPLANVFITYIIEKRKPPRNMKAQWTCQLVCDPGMPGMGVEIKKQVLVLVAKKIANGSFLISTCIGGGSNLVATVEARTNHVYDLYDNGLDDAQLLKSNVDALEAQLAQRPGVAVMRARAGHATMGKCGGDTISSGARIRQKIATICVRKRRENFRFWKMQTFCSCLLPELVQMPLKLVLSQPSPTAFKHSEEGEKLKRFFSELSWEQSPHAHLNRYQLLNGQSTAEETSSLTMHNPHSPKIKVLSVSKFSKRLAPKAKRFHVQFGAPLSLVHAFAIALCVLDH